MNVPRHMSRPVYLASRSPRRRRLLADAGVAVSVLPASIDDGDLRPADGITARHWVMALAYLKARSAAESLASAAVSPVGTVLAADTVCVQDGRILGQPVDEAHARAMLRAMRDAMHETVTGVCLVSLSDGGRWLFVDSATVHFGAVSDEAIERYLASGAWRGKAGAYNLQDRIDDGWPIECEGDPTTVMGLPMRRLSPWIEQIRGEAA
jgi:septum formation protein